MLNVNLTTVDDQIPKVRNQNYAKIQMQQSFVLGHKFVILNQRLTRSVRS